MESSIGEIIFVNDLDAEIRAESKNRESEFLRVFRFDELKIENSHEIIREAYISTEKEKLIIIATVDFKNEAQNALLKILEEPPENIRFKIITKNRSSILPTIRSRMILKNRREKKILSRFPIDIKRISQRGIYDFLKNLDSRERNSDLTKEDVRDLAESLLFELRDCGARLSLKELEYFKNMMLQNDQKERASYIFLPFLLKIHQKIKGKI